MATQWAKMWGRSTSDFAAPKVNKVKVMVTFDDLQIFIASTLDSAFAISIKFRSKGACPSKIWALSKGSLKVNFDPKIILIKLKVRMKVKS